MPRLSFNLNWMESLAVLDGCGNFGEAAKQLNITQSAMSQRIESLEVALGVPLVVRSRPLKLTPAGRMIASYCDRLNELHRNTQLEIAELLQEPCTASD